jgi:hypothetical protein
MFSIASLVSRTRHDPAAGDGLATDFCGFYDWMTEAGRLLFPKLPLVFMGITRGAEAFPILG